MIDLATCRRALWKYGSSVPYSEATVTDLGDFDSNLNQVMERFFTLGTWRSMWRKINLRVYDGRLTTPRGYDTCRAIETCCGPSPLYSQFHRLAAYGSVIDNVFTNLGGGPRLVDENAQTFRVPTGTFYLRAVATETNSDGFSFLGGFDQDENELFDVVTLALTSGATTTTQQYTQLPQIQKAVTNNAVYLYSVDVTSGEATLIGSYAPGETMPNYRAYDAGCSLTDSTDPIVVSAILKLGFVAAVAINDIIIPGHIGALKLGLMARQFEDKTDPKNAGIYWGPNYPQSRPGQMAGAIDLLDSELAELQASEQSAMNVADDFGVGSIMSVR